MGGGQTFVSVTRPCFLGVYGGPSLWSGRRACLCTYPPVPRSNGSANNAFGFVSFDDPRDAEDALVMDRREVDGHKLLVEMHHGDQPKPARLSSLFVLVYFTQVGGLEPTVASTSIINRQLSKNCNPPPHACFRVLHYNKLITGNERSATTTTIAKHTGFAHIRCARLCAHMHLNHAEGARAWSIQFPPNTHDLRTPSTGVQRSSCIIGAYPATAGGGGGGSGRAVPRCRHIGCVVSHGAAAVSCCVRVIGTCVTCVTCAGRATMTRREGGGGGEGGPSESVPRHVP